MSELVKRGMERTSSPWRLGPLRVSVGALLAAASLGAAAVCRSAFAALVLPFCAAEAFFGGMASSSRTNRTYGHASDHSNASMIAAF